MLQSGPARSPVAALAGAASYPWVAKLTVYAKGMVAMIGVLCG